MVFTHCGQIPAFTHNGKTYDFECTDMREESSKFFLVKLLWENLLSDCMQLARMRISCCQRDKSKLAGNSLWLTSTANRAQKISFTANAWEFAIHVNFVKVADLYD